MIRTLTSGVTGPRGSGFGLFFWRMRRAMQTGDTAGVTVRYPYKWSVLYTGAAGTSSSERLTYFEIPVVAGTLSGLTAKFDTAPAVSTTFTLYKNGSPTSLTTTCTGTAVSFDNTNTVSVALNDTIQIGITYASGTPDSANNDFQVSVFIT